MKPDRGSHVTVTLLKASRLFSRCSNCGKSSSSSRDSRAVSSATARNSLACEAIPYIRKRLFQLGTCTSGMCVKERLIMKYLVALSPSQSNICFSLIQHLLYSSMHNNDQEQRLNSLSP